MYERRIEVTHGETFPECSALTAAHNKECRRERDISNSQSNRDNYVKTAKHNYGCGRIS
jgi:hypothetical protein